MVVNMVKGCIWRNRGGERFK